MCVGGVVTIFSHFQAKFTTITNYNVIFAPNFKIYKSEKYDTIFDIKILVCLKKMGDDVVDTHFPK